MKRTLPIGIVISLFLSATMMFAQGTSELRGTVSTRNGEPVVSAKITVASKNGDAVKRGAIANLQGKYIVKNIPAGEYDVTASAIGFKEQKKTVVVPANGSVDADFGLSSSVTRMEEVVVTGQGAATERRQLTTTVESINLKDIENAPVRSIDQLLQGRVPGLSSFTPSGQPGTGARIVTRGVKSALSGSNPVIYIDGIRVDAGDNNRLSFGTGGLVSSALADLSTDNIERVEVIKGGAGSTLYGSEAANGVIQIFTKKGTPGDARWRFTAQTGTDLPEYKFTQEPGTKAAYKNGFFQGYSLSTQGGSEAMTYNVSGAMSDNTGILYKDQGQNRSYNFSGGLNAKASDKVQLTFSIGYARNQFQRLANANNATSFINDTEGESLLSLYAGNPRLRVPGNVASGINADSLLQLYSTPSFNGTANRFTTAFNVNYKPMDGFTNQFTIGLDYRKSDERILFPLAADPIYGAPSSISRSDRELSTLTLGYVGTLDLPKIGDFGHKISVGAQAFRINDVETNARGELFAVPSNDIDQTARQTTLESVYQTFNGGAFVNYKANLFDRFFLDVGLRVDANSTFGDKVSTVAYPKVSGSWNISEEAFYPFKDVVNLFKIRASYGETGNFPPAFTRDKQFTVRQYRDQPTIDFGNPGNVNLKAERTRSVEAGFDMALFDDRISLIFDYFSQTTVDGLFAKPNDPASGLGVQQTNLGIITNKGIEVAVSGILVQAEDFQMGFRVAFATLKNNVESLGGSAPFSVGGFAFANLRVEEGNPVGVFRVNVPIVDTSGAKAGQFNGLSQLNILRGTPTPTYTGSAGLDFTIAQNLTISVFGEFAGGHSILNQALSRRIVNALGNRDLSTATTPAAYPVYPDAAALIPKNPTTNEPLYSRNTASSYLLEDASWFKLREVNVRYRIPSILRGVTVFATGRNLLILTKAGADPETSFIRAGSTAGSGVDVGGIAGATVLNPKALRVGVELNF